MVPLCLSNFYDKGVPNWSKMNIVVEIVKKLGRDDVRSKTLSQGDSFESGVEVGF